MQIAFVVTPCLPVGVEGYAGVERIVTQLSEKIAEKYKVTVFCAKGSKLKNAKVVETVEPAFRGAIGELEQLEMIKDKLNDFDIVSFHWHSPPPYKENYIWEIHDLTPPVPNYQGNFFARSLFHAKFLERIWGWKVDFIYNCIDINEWEFSEEKEDFILFFSRITKGKGAITFAKWCKELKIKGIIAGTDDVYKGANPNELMEFYKELNSYTEFLGEVTHKQISKIMAKAKALVLPYNTKYFIPVFDLVVVEALACGTPVLTINTGAMLELLGKGKTRIGYVANDLNELKNAVKNINKFDFNYKKCRERAKEFDVERISEIWVKKCMY